MLCALFPSQYSSPIAVQLPPALLTLQTTINKHKWGILATDWKPFLDQFNLDPSKPYLTRQWMTTLLQQLWNTAWDLWRYCNGIVHKRQTTAQHEHLQLRVQQE